ncbi:MAG: sialate O-acetylesterase [Opitutaceae bacterium]|nr:sialate O-acetylesterase [Opitutaceae bacterium]
MRVCLRLALLLFAAVIRADVIPAPLFTDGAVLQRDKPLPVWGRADAGEKVAVSFRGETVHATAGPDGRWIVFLQAAPASAEGTVLTLSGKNLVTLRDIVVGDVWLASGQSNMEWPVSRAANAEQEIASARYPLLRQIRIERTVGEAPADLVKTTGWQPSTPATVGAFSAVAYFFARELHQKLGIPFGIINSSWGGTPVEAWMSPAALASDPRFAVVQERWQKVLADFPAANAAFDRRLADWTQAEAAAKAGNAAVHADWIRKNPRPRPPRGPADPWSPAGLFNGMINPLLPCALRGTIWYQGENNVDRAAEYHALFSAMITTWRAHFAQGDFPFYWVNLANFNAPGDPTGVAYAFLREAQTKTLALPNTGQALAIDIGHADDIHPTNKQDVGRRLALLAKRRVYDLVVDDTGPTFASITREGTALRVRFTNAETGLIARDKPVQSLEVAGADKVFRPALGKIDRDMLIVSSPQVKQPVAVRYAWRNAPEANLYNGAGLPAVPFRSDDW